MKDFRQLQVWENSHQLAKEVYKITALFPKEEMFDMISRRFRRLYRRSSRIH